MTAVRSSSCCAQVLSILITVARRVALAVRFKPYAPGNLAAAPLSNLPKRPDADCLPAPLSDSLLPANGQPVSRSAQPVLDLTGDSKPAAPRCMPSLQLEPRALADSVSRHHADSCKSHFSELISGGAQSGQTSHSQPGSPQGPV